MPAPPFDDSIPEMIHMLKIENLHARIDDKPILQGLSLTVKPGEVHAIMGPNGSGKSTLGYVLAGREGYEVTDGSAQLDDADLLAMTPEQRARAGLFLGFQYPVEIPGLSNANFLRQSVNALRTARGEPESKATELLKELRSGMKRFGLDAKMLQRSVNEGFSGGEKKRNEIFQMNVLQPRLAVLDEIDSGLDIDGLKVVAQGINDLRSPDRAFIVVTHYQRLLDYVQPDHVHVLSEGRIVRSGGGELAQELERSGYGWLEQEPSPSSDEHAGAEA